MKKIKPENDRNIFNEMYSLTVLEGRSLKTVSLHWNQGVSKVAFPPEVPGAVTGLALSPAIAY